MKQTRYQFGHIATVLICKQSIMNNFNFANNKSGCHSVDSHSDSDSEEEVNGNKRSEWGQPSFSFHYWSTPSLTFQYANVEISSSSSSSSSFHNIIVVVIGCLWGFLLYCCWCCLFLTAEQLEACRRIMSLLESLVIQVRQRKYLSFMVNFYFLLLPLQQSHGEQEHPFHHPPPPESIVPNVALSSSSSYRQATRTTIQLELISARAAN